MGLKPGNRSIEGPPAAGDFRVGVMTMDVERRNPDGFEASVDAAVRIFDAEVNRTLGLRVELLSFDGPHLLPAEGAYEPMDFLRLGMTEKLQRRIDFLLVVTEVDLASRIVSTTLALPSQLTNVAVISTKRLHGTTGGGPTDAAAAAVEGGRVSERLAVLLLHSFGHLLNLRHRENPKNAMFAFGAAADLDAMAELTEPQREAMRRSLPREAHERIHEGGTLSRAAFVAETLWRDRSSIAHAVARAHPLRLARRLPTMITASLSVLVVLFFSPEPWDIGSTVDSWQLVGFASLAVFTAAAALYRALSFGGLARGVGRAGRRRVSAESSVVTAAAVSLSLVATMAFLLVAFAALSQAGAATVFPRRLMATWPTVDPAVRWQDHLKVSLFIAAFATLAGSLGGRADRRDLVRAVLFEEEGG